LDTPHGRVQVQWNVEDDTFTVEADLPEGVEGILRLPGHEDLAIGSRRSAAIAALPPQPEASRTR
jgi:alpha-L-rhamnosidase